MQAPPPPPPFQALCWAAPLRGKVDLGGSCSPRPTTHWFRFSVRRPVGGAALSPPTQVFHFPTLHGRSCAVSPLQLMVRGNCSLFRSGGTFLLPAHRRWTDLPATATYNSSLFREVPSFHCFIDLCLLFGVSCLPTYLATFTRLTFPPTVHACWK